MSSYGSTHSTYLHPSQYPPPPASQHQQYASQPQPPYPTTPGPAPSSYPSAFYPPAQQPQSIYSTSPTAHPVTIAQSSTRARRSSSLSTHQHQPPLSYQQSAPIAIPNASSHQSTTTTYPTSPHAQPSYQPQPSSSWTQQPHFQAHNQFPSMFHSQSYPSHPPPASHVPHSSTAVDPDAKIWGEEALDEDTLREYERRYAKERELERRPTLGGSLISLARGLGRMVSGR